MKVLVYGFKPYGRYATNISQSVVEKLPDRFRKFIFQVQFDRQQFLNGLEKENPDIIIGLGQHPRARKVRIERIAKNLFGKKIEKKQYISKNGSARLEINLKLKPSKNMRISYDAGEYVCNYSMYICQEWANKKRKQFAFIHIPQGFSSQEIVSYLKSLTAFH